MEQKCFGYARVSSKEQNLDRQIKELLEFGIEERNIFTDKESGKDFQRKAYQSLIEHVLRQGDLLAVKSIDRLGRNYSEIKNQWKVITSDIGADIVILDMPLLDTRKSKDLVGTLIADIVLQILSFVAENERDNIKQRQAEGLAIVKAKGKHLGRKRMPPHPEWNIYYSRWKKKEITARECMKCMGLKKDVFYRLVKEYEKQ